MPQTLTLKEKAPSGVVCISIRPAAAQLKECLQLENNPKIFQEMRNQLKIIGRKHLAPHKAPSEQPGAITKIKAELRERYPDIFDSEDKERRLYLAVRVIYLQQTWRLRTYRRHHGIVPSLKGKHRKGIGHGRSDIKTMKNVSKNKRQSVEKMGKQIKKEKISKRTNPSTVPLQKQNHELAENSSRTFVWRAAPLNPSQAMNRPTGSVISAQTVIPSSASQSSSQRFNMSGPSTTATSSQDVLSYRRPSDSNIPPPTQISSGSYNPTSQRPLGTGAQAVLNFLELCTPSMAHLYHHFVNFGCANEEYLLAVSTWSPDVVRNFLTQVLTVRQTGALLVNSMDMFVLQTHFLAYYQK